MSRITEKGATGALEVFFTSPTTATTPTDASFATYVGSKYDTSDGREFVLVQNGAAALASGKGVAAVPNTANHIGLTVTAVTAANPGLNQPLQITATMGGTGVLPNEYAGGFLMVATGTGAGQYLKIASHPGQTSTTGSVIFNIESPEGLGTTYGGTLTLPTTSSTVSLFRNQFGSANGGTASTGVVNAATNGVVIAPTTVVSAWLGVSNYPVIASTSTVPVYALIQTHGLCSMLNHSGTTIGLNIGASTGVAGAFDTYAAATNTMIGYAPQAGTDTAYSEVFLTL